MSTPSSGAISIGNLQATFGVTSMGAMRSKNPNLSGSNILNLSDMRGINGGLVGWYDADSWTGTQWTDKSGSGNNAITSQGTIRTSVLGLSNLALTGGTTAGIQFPVGILPTNYTFFHVTKYAGASQFRIFDGIGTSNNWLSGFWGSGPGVAFHDSWLTDFSINSNITEWILSTDRNYQYRALGVDQAPNLGSGTSVNVSLNYGRTLERSDWACAEVLVFNKNLSLNEIVKIEQWLASKYMLQYYPPVTQGLFGYYPAESWTPSYWGDMSGNGNNVTTYSGTITKNYNAFNGRDFVSGGTAANMTFPVGVLPSTYTLFHVAKYNGTSRQRIINASDTNWLSGFYSGKNGLAFHNGWLTQTASTVHGLSSWVLSTDQNNLYRSNGVSRTTGSTGSPSFGRLTVNLPQSTYSAEISDWAVATIIVYNRTLSLAEIQTVERWLAQRYNMRFTETHRYVDFDKQAVDRTGNSITTVTGTPTYSAGIFNNCAYFNNAYGENVAPTNYVTVPNGDVFVGTSLSYWFRADDTTTNYQTMVAATQTGNALGCLQMDLITGSLLRAYIALPTQWNVTLTTGATISANTWYHVVLTITSAWVSTLYINGTQVATGTGTANSPAGWAQNYMIGGSGGLVRGFKGNIDEFRVYTRVLNTTEIRTLYSQQFRTNSILAASSAYRWLKFDESIKDETNNSQPSLVGAVTYLQGINGQAIYFNQTVAAVPVNYVLVPHNGYWGNMTLSFWFNTPSFAANQTIMGLTNSASSQGTIQMDLQTNAQLYAYIRIPNYWTVSITTSALSTNTWYHACLTITSAHVCTLYVNGVQASTATGTGAPPFDNSFMWKIGGSGDNGRSYVGYVDEFRVFTQVLTANQILALFSEGSEVARVPSITGVTTSSTYDNLIPRTFVSAMRPTPTSQGLQLWLDAEHYRPGSTTWIDQSDNNYNFSITATVFRWNGTHPHMDFSGSYGVAKRTADVPTFANATFIVFTAIRTDPGTDFRTLIRGYSNDHHLLVQTGTNLIGYYDHGTTTFYSSGLAVTSLFNPYEFNMWVLKLSKTSPYWQLSYNGSTVLANITNVNAIFDNGFAVIGGWQAAIGNTDPAVGAQFWGRISNFLYYSRHLTDVEIKNIFNQYRYRYNIFWENDARNIDNGMWDLVYEVTNPSRDASGNIVYATNNSTALAGAPFTRVAYYMQNRMGNGNTMYWVYVSFDAWSSTITDYRIPDASNIFSHNRNVTNIRVFSNHPQVGNYSVPYGRVFVNPYNFTTATTFGDGNTSTHDYDETVSTVAVSATSGHGAVMVHDITNKRTLLAWSMHFNTGYTVTVGIGNNDSTNINYSAAGGPNWTFAYNGAYGWKFQVLVGYPDATRLMYLREFTGDTWIDTTGNGYNATYVGGTLYTPNYGGGYHTPQSQITRYILLPHAALQALPSGFYWTMHLWFEILSFTGTERFALNTTVSGENNFMIRITSTTLEVHGSTLLSGAWPTWTVNTPILLTAVRRGDTTFILYKNGIWAATCSRSVGSTKLIQGWVLDQEQDSLQGTFDTSQNTNANWYEVSLMNRALDDDEIYAEYENTKNRYGGDTLELPVTSGLHLWLDAADASTFSLSTNNVTEWRDKSGNNRHYTQATAASQPLRNATRNGRSVVTFDGTKIMSPASALGNFVNGGTVIVAAKPAGTGYHCFYDSVSNYPMLWYRPDLRLELDAQIALSPTIYQHNTWFYSVQTVGTRNEWYLNGAYIGAGRTPSTGALTLWNRSNGQLYNGDFGEVLVYDRTLSSMEITLINQYLAKKWCIGGMIDRLSVSAKNTLRGAYSLRRLSVYYEGPTINVRRSTDNATSDFYGDINGNLGQGTDATGTRLATWLGAATGFVTTWYDQSGSGNHATQTNTALQPTISQVNMWIDFKYSDANGRYMNLPDGTVPAGNGNYTVTVKHGTITGPTSLPTNGGWLASGSGATNQANNFRRKADGYWNYWYNVDAGINTTVTPGNIVTFRYDGANRYGYVNTTGATSVTASTNRNATSINNRIGTTIVNEHLNGELYFLYIFGSSLSDADRSIAEFA